MDFWAALSCSFNIYMCSNMYTYGHTSVIPVLYWILHSLFNYRFYFHLTFAFSFVTIMHVIFNIKMCWCRTTCMHTFICSPSTHDVCQYPNYRFDQEGYELDSQSLTETRSVGSGAIINWKMLSDVKNENMGHREKVQYILYICWYIYCTCQPMRPHTDMKCNCTFLQVLQCEISLLGPTYIVWHNSGYKL